MCKAVYQAPAPHNTCGRCWLVTAQRFYQDMRGKGGSAVTSKARATHKPTHGLAITSCMRTAISRGKWQPWTAVSPLLGLISMVQPSVSDRDKPVCTAISKKIVGKTVHATISKGDMGYDQYTRLFLTL